MPRAAHPQVCSALQLNKAIPVLLGIRDNTKAAPQILEEIKGLREDIQPGYSTNFRQVQADVKAIKERLGMS
jgi:hypothetical protein